jgi:hypothetical protein
MKNIFKNLNFAGIDKIAFLALLLITILAAKMLVSVRTKIELSKPIVLAGTGLAVSLPQGPSWQSDSQWNYNNTSYVLIAGKTTTATTFICHLANFQDSPEQYLNNKFSRLGITNKGEFSLGDKKFHWVQFETMERFLSPQKTIQSQRVYRIIAMGNLNLSRQLEIRVESFEGSETISRIFAALQKGLAYNDDPQMIDGINFSSDFSNRISAEPVVRQNSQYLTMDSSGKPVGFYLEKLSHLASENTAITSFEYMNDQNAGNTKVEELTFSADLQSFSIKSKFEYQQNARQEFYEILYNHPVLQLQAFTLAEPITLSLPVPPIPEYFYQIIAKSFQHSDSQSIILDILDSRGRIVPTIFEKQPQDHNSPNTVIILRSLDDQQTVNHIILDANGSMIKLINLSSGYESTPAEKSEIEKLFPMWYELIQSYNSKQRI